MPTYRHGRHEHGQNFVTDPLTIAAITRLVAVTKGPIIEIGPGDGALTTPLARLNRPITAVEIDARLARRLTERHPSDVNVITDDFLSYRLPTSPHVLVGNLPFHQTTAMLRRILHAPGWTEAILLVQWEVARRRAGVGGATMMTAQWALVRVLPAWPRPSPCIHPTPRSRRRDSQRTSPPATAPAPAAAAPVPRAGSPRLHRFRPRACTDPCPHHSTGVEPGCTGMAEAARRGRYRAAEGPARGGLGGLVQDDRFFATASPQARPLGNTAPMISLRVRLLAKSTPGRAARERRCSSRGRRDS